MPEKLTYDEYSAALQIADLRINALWDAAPESIPEPDYTNVHFHTYYEILVSVGGVALTLFRGETIFVPAGKLCLIPPNIYHSTGKVSAEKSKRALRFMYEKADSYDGGEPIYERFHAVLSDISVPIVLEETDAHAVYTMLTDCSRELESGAPYAKAIIRFRLGMFFVQLLRRLSEQKPPAAPTEESFEEDSRRKKIEAWIQQNFRNNISEKELAAYMNLSERQTTRMLTRIYRCGFREVLINLRMHSAAELLTMTEQSVEEIAFAVGYRSLSGFYSAFSKYWGISAMQYRRSSYNINNNSDCKTPSAQT